MRRLVALVLALPVSVAHAAPNPSSRAQIFTIEGPTIIAFFVPNAQKENGADEDEALDDFQWYAANASNRMKAAGVAFHVVYASSFGIRTGEHTELFRPKEILCGYYFIAPGNKPRIEYGVRTDDDLMDIAHERFGVAAK